MSPYTLSSVHHDFRRQVDSMAGLRRGRCRLALVYWTFSRSLKLPSDISHLPCSIRVISTVACSDEPPENWERPQGIEMSKISVNSLDCHGYIRTSRYKFNALLFSRSCIHARCILPRTNREIKWCEICNSTHAILVTYYSMQVYLYSTM